MYLRTFEICLEIYELDPTKFSVLAWQAALKTTKLKLDLLTDINILLIVEKGQRRNMLFYLPICKS